MSLKKLLARDGVVLTGLGAGVSLAVGVLVFGVFGGPVRDRGEALRAVAETKSFERLLAKETQPVSSRRAQALFAQLGGWGKVHTDARTQGLCQNGQDCPEWYVEYPMGPRACAQATEALGQAWPMQSRAGKSFDRQASPEQRVKECLNQVQRGQPLRLGWSGLQISQG